ncbi:cyclic nucleotide-binding domain-containing protein [Lamprobacter modestohalophilus]|uniref:Crp/Fnr family transcriptional regulator n=1 Tax=Lamprobacter modestohalophilus TaxID=1064514 RepID=UPI002ADEDA4F|nr:cyclic nucleotide-binding domain-containing protein [Lamprobacter modestohalophilus]MEA1053062.1 cyclic nucleotide-binding domain-containing protein [Lamprobacter modestohalophilus]
MTDQTTDQQKTAWLQASVLAEELDASEVATLAQAMGVMRLAEQDSLVEEGDARRTLFVLVEGRLDVLHDHQGTDSAVYRMSPGECAGTRAFVDGSPRKAGLRAAGDGVVLTLEPDDFEALLAQHPMLVLKVMRALFRITHSNLMRANQESDALRNYVTRSHGRY